MIERITHRDFPVCIAIAIDRRLHNVTNYFLFSLALADLLVCSLLMPLSLWVELRQGVWMWNFWWCLAYSWSDVFLCSASIVHMSVISLDRFLGISNPLKMKNRSRRVVALKIAFVWLMTTVISSPLVVLAILDRHTILDEENTCEITNGYYMIYGSTLSFLIPFAIMAVTYVKTTNLLKRQAAQLSLKTADRHHDGLRRTIMSHKKLGQAKTYSYNYNSNSTGQAATANSGANFTRALNNSMRRSSMIGGDNPTSTTPAIIVTTNNNEVLRRPSPAPSVSPPSPDASNPKRAEPTEPPPALMSRARHNYSPRTLRLYFQRSRTPQSYKHSQQSQQQVSGSNDTGGASLESANTGVSLEENSSGSGAERSHSRLRRRSNIKQQLCRLRSQTSIILMTISGRSQSLMHFTNKELANEHKATRVLAVVFACFFICWTPFFLLNFMLGFCGEHCASIHPPEWVSSLFLWLGYISSTFNPLIYTTFNKRFREAFIRILQCHCFRTPRDNIWQSRSHTYVPGDAPSSWSLVDRPNLGLRGSVSYCPLRPITDYQNTSPLLSPGIYRKGMRDALLPEASRDRPEAANNAEMLSIPVDWELTRSRIGDKWRDRRSTTGMPGVPRGGRRASLYAPAGQNAAVTSYKACTSRGRLSLGVVYFLGLNSGGQSPTVERNAPAKPKSPVRGSIFRLPHSSLSSGLPPPKPKRALLRLNRLEEEEPPAEQQNDRLREVKRMLGESVNCGPLSRSVSAAILEVAACRKRDRRRRQIFREESSSTDEFPEDDWLAKERGTMYDRRKSEYYLRSACQPHILGVDGRKVLLDSAEIPLAIAQRWTRMRPVDRSRRPPSPNDEQTQRPTTMIPAVNAAQPALESNKSMLGHAVQRREPCEKISVSAGGKPEVEGNIAPLTRRLIKLDNNDILSVSETTI